MKSLFKEFKDFAVKGNMIDMAIGIIIGTAFNEVVNTLVKKVIMPPLSLMTDDVNLSNKKWILREATEAMEEVAIGYGEFIEVILDFGIIAFTIFVMLKFINRFKEKSEDPANAEVVTPKNIELLSNLESLMKEQNTILKNQQQR
ncbi:MULTISPECIES: large-conductance mechanosensitive channel protein MscL [Maribacter]|uniref:Large-conductance mechanosensitive channel n=2 Tax=Maribacter TaxID=252356 RepID=A0A5B2TSL0_9FLAO|nr:MULTISPECIES: large-conductance mechanosensitive channel protein MscL [Maribacter]KAA2217113.1 large-conductance mechanosensitive channel protein MscL [Maribacter flavus]MDC6405477.1 large-conductance mechanosensitive channel protein MscL [Maribacter sp. PR66]MEE1972755.1 large-conductance mechanosensitive channel protein MscL [Maribacter flavus]TLF44903.1 large-conductance mechanosensitive channel protein MscL [Maribacter aurantiacus]